MRVARIFRRFIPAAHVIPFPFGISNRCWNRDGAWCWWVPLNLLVRWVSNFWWRLSVPRGFTAREDSRAASYVIADLKAENAALRARNEYLEGSVEHQDGRIVQHLVRIGQLERELAVAKRGGSE